MTRRSFALENKQLLVQRIDRGNDFSSRFFIAALSPSEHRRCICFSTLFLGQMISQLYSPQGVLNRLRVVFSH